MQSSVAFQQLARACPPTEFVGMGPTSVPILHLHLLQRCNLSCAHCYSNSSPAARAALTLDEALGSIRLAGQLGYTHIAISGGEPLLSPHLESVIGYARELGQHVSLVTNGLQAANRLQIRRLVDANSVCVSLDGIGATHDAMRGRLGAYDSALRALEALNEAGMHCGASCGVSVGSLDEMEALATAATTAGATFVNFHAVEAAGRALTLKNGDILDRTGQTLMYIVAHIIGRRAEAGSHTVHCDLIHKSRAAERPGLLYVDASNQELGSFSTASQIGVLVVEPTGWLSPICYGFDRRLSMGTLQKAIESEGETLSAVLPHVLQRLKAAGAALLRELEEEEEWVVFNPSAELARVAAAF